MRCTIPVHGDLAKPAPGTATRERRARARKVRAIESLRKVAAKVRDQHRCRRPGCAVHGRGLVESAHLEGKQMGGDHGLKSASVGCFVTLCHEHHQGSRSLHSHHLAVRPMTDQGADGPLAWYARESLTDDFRLVGTSQPPSTRPRR